MGRVRRAQGTQPWYREGEEGQTGQGSVSDQLPKNTGVCSVDLQVTQRASQKLGTPG